MNWFSRIFGRRNDSDYAGQWDEAPETFRPELPRAPSLALPAPASLPTFTRSAVNLGDTQGLNLGGADISALRNAFAPAQPVSDIRRFAGRSELLRRVIRALEHQNLHVVVYGDRGIGKTSMLRVVNELATSAQYIVHYSSCGEDTDFCSTFRSALRDVPLLYFDGLSAADEEVERGGTFADRLPAGEFSVADLVDTLARISGTRVLIILDEFDRAVSGRFRNSVAELIKSVSDRGIRVQLLIGGVASNFTDLIAHVPSIRRNIVGINVPNMTNDEVRELVAISTNNVPIKFQAAAQDRLVTISAGLPYLASLIGQHAMLAALEAGNTDIRIADVALAIDRAKEELLSRMTPVSQYGLECAGALTKKSLIGRAAAAAVSNGGMILDGAITQELANLTGPTAAVVEPVPDDPRGGWRFKEDGTSTYVWLASQS